MELGEVAPINNIKEEVNRFTVNEIVKKIANHYQVGENCLNKIKDTRVCLVNKDIFLEEIKIWGEEVLGLNLGLVVNLPSNEKQEKLLKVLGLSPQTLENKAKENRKVFEDEYGLNSGICISDGIGKIKILINKDITRPGEEEMVLTHELIHALVYEETEQGGFKEGGSTLLDEAMVQLMTLRVINSEMPWREFMEKIIKNEVNNQHYNKEVISLMTVIKAADLKNDGETMFYDSATDYFNGENGVKAIMFKMKLYGSIPESIGSGVNKVDNFREKVIALYQKVFEPPKKAARN